MPKYFLITFFLLTLSFSALAENAGKFKYGDITVSRNQAEQIEVELPSEATFRDFALAQPSRLVIDLKGVKNSSSSMVKTLSSNPVIVARFGTHEDFVRLVIEISNSTEAPTYSIEAQPQKLIVKFTSTNPSITAANKLIEEIEPRVSIENTAVEVATEAPSIEAAPATPAASRLNWSRNQNGLIFKNSGSTTLLLDQCAVCTNDCSDLPPLELESGAEKGMQATIGSRISCIVKDSTRSERLLITPQSGSSGEL